jgi:general stress protein 26
MGDYKNLSGAEAIAKMKELIEGERTCLFVTRPDQLPLSTRPMGTGEVDEQGAIWFMSRNDTEKIEDLRADKRVQLFYSNKGSSEFLSIYGEASLSTDRNKIEKLWNPIVKAWFKEGKKDPAIILIRVKPLDAYYWDTKGNNMISLIKIMAGALTGQVPDDGIEGRIRP